MKSGRRGWALCLAASLLLLACPAHAEEPPLRLSGRRLSKALTLLQSRGLRLVFSDRLVRPAMVVGEEPAPGPLRERLEEILAPHGLTTREGPAAVLVIVSSGAAAPSAEIRGRVVDAQTGEPLQKARVTVRGVHHVFLTGEDGRFTLVGLPPGDAEITATTVGYGVARRRVRVGEEAGDLLLRLNQEALKASDVVTVKAEPFAPTGAAVVTEQALGGTELRNLASVLTDDPLRSIHALPGVAAADDFSAAFSVRGSGLPAMGYYMDGILMNVPFHTMHDIQDGYSITIVNGDLVESVALLGTAPPARYGDRVGGALDVRTRDGSRERLSGRASLGVLGASASLEGPLAGSTSTSWLVTGRKSYMGYVLDRLGSTSAALGFYDVAAKLTHQPGSAHRFTLLGLHGHTRNQNRSIMRRTYDLEEAVSQTDLATAQWRFLPSARGAFEASAHVIQETAHNRTVEGTPVLNSQGEQWGARAEATYAFGPHRLEAGASFRGSREDTMSQPFCAGFGRYCFPIRYGGRNTSWGAHVQDEWSLLDQRVGLSAGARFDRQGETGESLVQPRAAVSLALSRRTRLYGGLGAYGQFPTVARRYGRLGDPTLRAERALHATAGLEHLVGDKVRVRVEAFHVEGSQGIRAAGDEWRLEQDRVISPGEDARFGNTVSSTTRGVEILAQRRSANGITGWIAYTLGHVRNRDVRTLEEWDGDFDQRHTFTAFASWRVSATAHLSTKLRYGSGLPVAGYFRQGLDGIYLAEDRNRYRPEGYARWDVRGSQQCVFRGWKLTLHTEVINVLNRGQRRYTGLERLNPYNGRVAIGADEMFPFLPSVGVTAEF